MSLGRADPGCQRTKPPFPGPQRQSNPGPSATLPMSTGFLPGALEGRWEHQKGHLRAGCTPGGTCQAQRLGLAVRVA